MPLNYPGPYEIRLNYTTNEPAPYGEHQLRLSLDLATVADPGEDFDQFVVLNTNGSTGNDLDYEVESFLAFLGDFHNSAGEYTSVELWEYEEGTFNASYLAAYTPIAQPSDAGSTQAHSQGIITFRTRGGGIAKVDIRGITIAPGTTQSYPFDSGTAGALAAYMISSSVPWLGRDNTGFLLPLKFLPGTNEAAWKDRYRP